MSCKILSRDILHLPIDVLIDDPALDFYRAKKAADARTRQLTEEPMLLAWYDRKSSEFSPGLNEAAKTNQVGWSTQNREEERSSSPLTTKNSFSFTESDASGLRFVWGEEDRLRVLT